MPLLAVAREWGLPPLTVLAGRPNKWRMDDSLLAAAYAAYLATRVGPSGYPLRDAADPAKKDGWNVDTDTEDYAQTALNAWQTERESNDKRAILPKVFYHRIIKPWER